MSQHGDRAGVVKQHRDDHAAGCVALSVVARQPAGNTKSNQRHASYTGHGQTCGRIKGAAEQDRSNQRGYGQQGNSGWDLDNRGGEEECFMIIARSPLGFV